MITTNMENQLQYNVYMDHLIYSRNSWKYPGLDIQGTVVWWPIIANPELNFHPVSFSFVEKHLLA